MRKRLRKSKRNAGIFQEANNLLLAVKERKFNMFALLMMWMIKPLRYVYLITLIITSYVIFQVAISHALWIAILATLGNIFMVTIVFVIIGFLIIQAFWK